MEQTHFTEADRKLLTQLEMGQKILTEGMRDIQKKLDSDVFEKKIDAESTHLAFDRKFQDIETRMRWVERISYSAVAVLAAIQFYLNYLK
jgi:hypothetical protein